MRTWMYGLAALMAAAHTAAARAEQRPTPVSVEQSRTTTITTSAIAPVAINPGPALQVPAPVPAERQNRPLDETVERIPVTVELDGGRRHTGDMVLTVMRPEGPGPFPAIVMSHGRDPETRDEPARFRYVAVAKYWLRRGFAVFVPTRLGYGESGTEVDPEDAGLCADPQYRRPMQAMADQIAATVAFARTQPWVDGGKIILAGQSYGGFGTIAALGRGLPGVIGAVNFAGGAGGNADARPGRPCMPERLAALYAEAGRGTTKPALWIYAKNDQYWGPRWPARWHKAFSDAGGRGEFISLDPVGDDGHVLLRTAFEAWRPRVDTYLAGLGFDAPKSDDLPRPTGYAAIADQAKVPYVTPAVRANDYKKFLQADLPRAFALAVNGSWAWSSGDGAVGEALDMCKEYARTDCRLYAVDDHVVWWEPEREARADAPAAQTAAPRKSLGWKSAQQKSDPQHSADQRTR